MTSVRLLIVDLSVDGVYRTAVCFRAARHPYHIIDVHIAISVYLLEQEFLVCDFAVNCVLK